MARRVSVDLIGDPHRLVAAFKKSGNAADSFGRDLKGLGITARKSAETQIQATIKKDARLRREIGVYREIAAAAKRGSREQIAAANLAAGAERRLAGSLAVTSREARRHARSAGSSHRELGRGARGALAGSGAFRGLGRSLAFASSYFIGGYGLIYGIKSSISAASDLEEQVAKTNVVFGRSSSRIISWSATTARSFGISKRAALTYASSFGALLRPLGIGQKRSAGLSRSLVERAADLASFYNTDETDALQALQSGLVGQVRPLRRYGVQLSADRMKAVAFSTGIAKSDVDPRKVAEAEAGVTIAQVKLAQARAKHGAGSVEALAAARGLMRANDALKASLSGSKKELTAQEKTLARYAIIVKDTRLAHGDFARTSGHLAQQTKILNAQLDNQREKLGNALKPIVLGYITSLNNWLSKSRNQAQVTRTVKQVVHEMAHGVKVAAGIIRVAADVARKFAHAVGGWRTAFKLIIAGVLIGKLAKLAGGLHNIYREARLAGGGRGVGGLLGNLTALKALGAIGIVITVTELYEKVLPNFKGKHYSGIDLFHDLNKLVPLPGHKGRDDSTDNPGAEDPNDAKGGVHGALRKNAARHAKAAAVEVTTGGGGGGETPAERRMRLARERALRARQKLLAHQRAVAAAARREARQFRALGLGADGSELVPGRDALRKQLGSVEAAFKGTFLDTGKNRSLMHRIRKLLSGQLGALSKEVRSKIKELLDGLKGQMGEFDGFNLSKADRRRRFLDRSLRDHYRKGHSGVTGTGPGGSSTTHVTHFSPTIYTDDPGKGLRAARQAHWQMRNQFA